MKVITNPTDKDITIGVEGYDYTLPKYAKVLVEENVAKILVGLLEFLDVSDPPARKGPTPIPKAERRKTIGRLQSIQDKQNVDMSIHPNSTQDATSPDGIATGMDRDGVEWVGPGIEMDDLTGGGVFR